jgi:hypothetical protein
MSSRRYPTSTLYGTRAARAQARDALLTRQRTYDRHAEPVEAGSGREALIRHQGISVLTQLSGPQFVIARATGAGQVGAFLTVVIGTVVITFTDRAAARRYAGAWLGHRTTALGLPVWAPAETRTNRYLEPGVVVCATATDHTTTRVTAGSLLVIIGRVSWEVLDRKAFTTVAAMWQEVTATADTIWPT